MTYTYAYKTSDGTRHEAAMDAPSREEVFSALRKQGIKPIKVVAADGSKANGEIRGVRKRVVAALVAIVAIGVGIVAYRGGTRSVASESAGDGTPALPFLTDQTRRQVIGDAAVVEKGIRTGWADVFDSEGDRFLASFAIPGVKAGVRATSVEALEAALKLPNPQTPKPPNSQTPKPSNPQNPKPQNLKTSKPQNPKTPKPKTSKPQNPKTSKPPPSLEARQIVAMVEGMKQEARAYIAAGGSVVEYGKRLTERQDAEVAVYKRAEAEIQAAQKTLDESAFNALLEQRNDELRNLGIRPITLAE